MTARVSASELRTLGDMGVLERRPAPGQPRPYRFPSFLRERLSNGFTVISAHVAGRALLSGHLVIEGGAATEPTELAGVTALAARALTEGTRRRDAIAFIEAAERLGADLHAETGWETVAGSVDVPRSRFGPALELLAEMVLEPSFPEREIERLREERINDLLQVRADPRRRVEREFARTIYSPASPFSRPSGGTEETVAAIDRSAVVARHQGVLDPRGATLIVAGDLTDVPVLELAERTFGGWSAGGAFSARVQPDASANPAGSRVVLVDRPGSPQTEIRIGHVGLPRKISDFHAVQVMSAILGGLFNSRLQRLLREERGYTYGIGAGFEFRRSPGPFAVRTAVQTEVTGPAIEDILGELRRIATDPITPDELREARDYLIGVFPLRFEGSAQVATAIAGLVIHDLPDDELDRYRPAVAAVAEADVLAAAAHVRPAELSIVLVGDGARVHPQLASAGLPAATTIEEPLVPAELAPLVAAADVAAEGAGEEP